MAGISASAQVDNKGIEMAKKPTKGSLNWKYEVHEHKPEWAIVTEYHVEGPNTDGRIFCDKRSDAEMVAAALNFAANYQKLKRNADNVKQSIDELLDTFN